MAGNKNPWRDILTILEWQKIVLTASHATCRAQPALFPRPRNLLIDHIEHSIRQYHAVAKDRYTLFHDRIIKLDSIARVAAAFVDEYRRSWSDTTSLASGGIAVWANSLAHRAAKKAGYLTTMEQWHQTAKDKYKDRLQMSLFLRGLAKGGHVKDAAEKLHATPYATIEKIDPYHRQTIVFLDRDVTNASDAHDASDNKMGEAFLDYLNDYRFEGATNPDPSFYEWLEYSEFCIGTPGVLGDARFMNPQTVSYAGHDLTHVRVMPSRLIAEQVITGPGVWTNLDTSILPASGKGPPGAAAFVWDADCNLYLHTHSLDFVHASAKQGRKIRCSGMLVAVNGIVTYMSNSSGHYMPTAQSIYNFGKWLNAKKCVHGQAIVEINHSPPLDGKFLFPVFLNNCTAQGFVAPAGLTYPQ